MKTLTSFILPSAHRKKWYILDCKMYQSISFGRIAPTLVQTLIGKNTSSYDPSTDVGNYVILINAEYIKFDQEIERFYVFRPGHPGKSLKRLRTITTQRFIETCIFNMLPNGFTKKQLRKQLKIYNGNEHPHIAQSLSKIIIKSKKNNKAKKIGLSKYYEKKNHFPDSTVEELLIMAKTINNGKI
jgi:large subunit ribosomal protein L13